MKSSSEFPAVTSYKQVTTSNASWVNVTLIKTDADGSCSQVLILAAKK